MATKPFLAPNVKVGQPPQGTPYDSDKLNDLVQQNLLTSRQYEAPATGATPIQGFASGFGNRQATDDMALTKKLTDENPQIDKNDLIKQIAQSHASKGLGSDIMAGAQDIGTGVLGGLTGLAQYANTAEGKGILAGMQKDPDMAAAYLGQQETAQGKELGQNQMAYEAEQNRQKNLQDYAKSQAELEAANKRAEAERNFQSGENTKNRGVEVGKFDLTQSQQKLDDLYKQGAISSEDYQKMTALSPEERNAVVLHQRHAINRLTGGSGIDEKATKQAYANLQNKNKTAVAMR